MNVLIKTATILDVKSDFHNKTQDILVENGYITAISSSIKNSNNYPEISLENLHISQGWFDSSVSFGEPGFEDRETIANGLLVAARSGFTNVALNPNTSPVIDSHSEVAFVQSKSKNTATQLHPIGSLTQSAKGLHLAELYDMHTAGSVAFGDYKKPISNPNILKIALQYAANFGGLVQSFPLEEDISRSGVVNENVTSTRLGLKGNPNLAEELQISRDISILEYTGGSLHIPTISTAKSVDLIREAKSKGLDVSCSVAIHNLIFTDNCLESYNTNYKVTPPLRTKNDIDMLIEGLKDGTIEMVTADHDPIAIEHKKVEFDFAAYGTIGLESAFGTLNSIFTTKQTVQLLTNGKKRFNIPENSISVGNECRITLFNPTSSYAFEEKHIHSKSKNSMFLGHQLKGNVYGIIANSTCSIDL
jgi:dihydroorotase